METKNGMTGKRQIKWSQGERGLLWGSGLLLALGCMAFFWNRSINDDLPTDNIPTPTLPSPNAYDEYLKAGQQIKGNPISQSGKPTAKQLTAALPQNLPALKAFRNGMAYPFRSPPIRSFFIRLPQNSNFRELARLLILEGRVYEIRGDYGSAAQSYLDCFQLGMDVPRGGALVPCLVGIACEAIGRRSLWEITDKLSASDARAATKRLEELSANRYPFAETMQEEKWMGQASLLEILRKENTLQLAAGLANSPTPVSLAAWRNFVALVGRGKKRIYQDYSAYFDAIIAQARLPYTPNPPPIPVPNDPVNQMLTPTFDKAQIKDWDMRVQSALLIATLALRAYMVERGDYPATLNALVTEGYLSQVPQDPFAGTAPLRYRRISKTQYILYSIGPDSKDDGGKPIITKTGNGILKRWAETGMVGDFVPRANTY